MKLSHLLTELLIHKPKQLCPCKMCSKHLSSH